MMRRMQTPKLTGTHCLSISYTGLTHLPVRHNTDVLTPSVRDYVASHNLLTSHGISRVRVFGQYSPNPMAALRTPRYG